MVEYYIITYSMVHKNFEPKFAAHSMKDLFFSPKHKLKETGLAVGSGLGIVGVGFMALSGNMEIAAGSIVLTAALIANMLWNINEIVKYSRRHLREN